MTNMKFFEDLSAAREGLLSLGFWALQIHRFGHLRFRYKSKIIRWPIALIHIPLQKFSEIFFGITIGAAAKIGDRFSIEHSGCIVIHGCASIGNDCLIRQGVTIGNKSMDDPLGAPQIGNRVNIGAGAKIIGRINIGDDVDIGANAVVTKDIPSGAVVVGIPGKILRMKNSHKD